MRHGTAGRRSRNRGHGRRSGGGGGNFTPNRNQVFDSNGPDVRIRGTAYQIQEKYSTLAKDANAAGDHVLAESYLQHAEHYKRIVSGWMDFVEGRSDAYLYSRQEQFQQPGADGLEQGPVTADADNGQDIELGLPASIIGARPVAVQNQTQMEDA